MCLTNPSEKSGVAQIPLIRLCDCACCMRARLTESDPFPQSREDEQFPINPWSAAFVSPHLQWP